MSITGISNYPVLPLPKTRSGGDRVSPQPLRRENEPDNDTDDSRLQSDSREVYEPSAQTAQKPVDAPSRTKEVFSRRQAAVEDISFSTRKALDAFAANTSSPTQSLGVELAGIDVFV